MGKDVIGKRHGEIDVKFDSITERLGYFLILLSLGIILTGIECVSSEGAAEEGRGRPGVTYEPCGYAGDVNSQCVGSDFGAMERRI